MHSTGNPDHLLALQRFLHLAGFHPQVGRGLAGLDNRGEGSAEFWPQHPEHSLSHEQAPECSQCLVHDTRFVLRWYISGLTPRFKFTPCSLHAVSSTIAHASPVAREILEAWLGSKPAELPMS